MTSSTQIIPGADRTCRRIPTISVRADHPVAHSQQLGDAEGQLVALSVPQDHVAGGGHLDEAEEGVVEGVEEH